VIVQKGLRRGLLLPDLEGVESPQEQLYIAKLKAGIPPEDEDVQVFRFEVRRFH
jgi:AMMECR1 domain-containing protein